ncbi:MAG: methyl-accepting chemotaxis protein [Pseudomonadota bacterium]
MQQPSSASILRHTAAKIIIGILISYAVILPAGALLIAPGRVPLSALILVANALGCALFWRSEPDGKAVPIVLSLGLVTGPVVGLALFADHPWQIDLHMSFFAALAISALLCDWRAVLTAALAIAVHHLLLNVLIPSLLFPGGTDYARVLLHAGIVVAETGALIWLTKALGRALATADQKIREAEEQTLRAEQLSAEQLEAAERERKAEEEKQRMRAEAEAEALRQEKEAEAEQMRLEAEAQKRTREEKEREVERKRLADEKARQAFEDARRQTIRKLSSEIGDVVAAAQAGDFSQKVKEDFDDDELNALARNLNNLISTVNGGLQETISVLSSMEDSDLTKRVEGEYAGVFADMQRGVNQSADGLSSILSGLRQSSSRVAQSLNQLVGGVNSLSSQTCNQAATLEETAAALKSFSSSVTQAAKRAEDMRTNARQTQSKAEKSGSVMQEATDAMDRVAESSTKMSEITEVIESIAFQTNLLALNAGVEAARAGDAGRGFAVVASEVRNLAQSTAEASKEVGQLLTQSKEEIKGGVELVALAAADLQGIVGEVAEIVGSIDQISEATKSQNATIGEINAAMASLDEMTQENSLLAEQNSSAIKDTKSAFDEVDVVVERFKLDDEQGWSAHAA